MNTSTGYLSVPFRTLLWREMLRFLSVPTQTVVTPVISAGLYLVIFGLSLGDRLPRVNSVPYGVFIVPGLITMGLLNHAFQNTASSIMIAKFEGNIVDVLVAPLSYLEIALGYMLAGVARGFLVGGAIYLVSLPVAGGRVAHPVFALLMAFLAASTFALFGIIAAVWAERFDGISAFSTYIIVPLTYLGGVFFSIRALPPPWGSLALGNPLFYMIDGVRFGFLGASDIPPRASLAIASLACLFVFAFCVLLLRSGYKLRK